MFKMKVSNGGNYISKTHSVEEVSDTFYRSIPEGRKVYISEVSEKKIGYYQQVTTEVKEQVEVGKTYKTRDGKFFYVVKIDLGLTYPVFGYCLTVDDIKGRKYTLDGIFNRNSPGPDFPYNLILETKKATSVKFFPTEEE